jgi:hypothetical protein
MYSLSKLIVLLTLTCYLGVSGAASSHGIQAKLGTSNHSMVDIDSANLGMSPNCHQQQNDDVQAQETTACEMFCAAMSNTIAHECLASLLSKRIDGEIVFFPNSVAKFVLDTESRPPK